MRKERRDNDDGTTTYVYEQANVHDFAWAASPLFVEMTRRFVAGREVTAAEYAAATKVRLRAGPSADFTKNLGRLEELERLVEPAP